MNEAETRAGLIDPQLMKVGWGVVEDSNVLRERNVYKITDGRMGQKNQTINCRLDFSLQRNQTRYC